MKNNKYRRPNGTTRHLRRIEDKLDTIISYLARINARMNWLQLQIDSRNEIEMDSAIDRLRLSAMSLKELAEEEAKQVRERYGTSRI